MSGLPLKKMICPATSNWRCYCVRHFGLSNHWNKATSFLPWNSIAWTAKGPLAVGVKSYSTVEEDLPKPPIIKKKEHPNAKKVIGHVGKIIPYKIIQVLNYEGEEMGKMLKKDVIRMVEKQNLKLISVAEHADPPVYKLLTGLIYTKELSFLASISQHDLDVKLKQVAQWIEKKRHVKITVLNSRGDTGPDKVMVLQQVIEKMQDHATCLAQPRQRKDGRAMICTLRPWSEKELQKRNKDLEVKKQIDITTPETSDNQGTVSQGA
ncbi:translation initiation factor IF-3, mitochondrial isoform X2 [Mixophyes fleayi]|uniref:translation initiation factor IF-3, mitochondrial isoform X2 n=1 Tax=Mixophyes fleayi TaxID=3061075 RepID=UPI003F4E2E10